jgi:hypothetical protein
VEILGRARREGQVAAAAVNNPALSAPRMRSTLSREFEVTIAN